MTTDLTTTDRHDLVTAGDAEGLSGAFGQEDLSLPVLSLVQPMSQDKGEAGTFSLPDGRNFADLHVVVLELAATRAMWAPMGEGDGRPICRSGDRKTGFSEKPNIVYNDSTMSEPMEIVCETCPHFADDQFSRDDYLCKMGYTLLCYETEQMFPFVFFAKGAAVKAVKQRIVSPALMNYQQTGQATPWRFEYHWQPKLVQSEFKYYVPDIRIEGPELDEDRQAHYASMARSYRGRASQQTVEDEPVDTQEGANGIHEEQDVP